MASAKQNAIFLHYLNTHDTKTEDGTAEFTMAEESPVTLRKDGVWNGFAHLVEFSLSHWAGPTPLSKFGIDRLARIRYATHSHGGGRMRRQQLILISLSAAVLTSACLSISRRSAEQCLATDKQNGGFLIGMRVMGVPGPLVTVNDAESADTLLQWFQHRPTVAGNG